MLSSQLKSSFRRCFVVVIFAHRHFDEIALHGDGYGLLAQCPAVFMLSPAASVIASVAKQSTIGVYGLLRSLPLPAHPEGVINIVCCCLFPFIAICPDANFAQSITDSLLRDDAKGTDVKE
jgi:hypothetical protein